MLNMQHLSTMWTRGPPDPSLIRNSKVIQICNKLLIKSDNSLAGRRKTVKQDWSTMTSFLISTSRLQPWKLRSSCSKIRKSIRRIRPVVMKRFSVMESRLTSISWPWKTSSTTSKRSSKLESAMLKTKLSAMRHLTRTSATALKSWTIVLRSTKYATRNRRRSLQEKLASK